MYRLFLKIMSQAPENVKSVCVDRTSPFDLRGEDGVCIGEIDDSVRVVLEIIFCLSVFNHWHFFLLVSIRLI